MSLSQLFALVELALATQLNSTKALKLCHLIVEKLLFALYYIKQR